jgi:hypothetical protein
VHFDGSVLNLVRANQQRLAWSSKPDYTMMKTILLVLLCCSRCFAGMLMQSAIPGCVGWWTMNEGTGSNLVNYGSLGAAYNGLAINNPTWTNGVVNNGLTIKSSPVQYVDCGGPIGNGFTGISFSLWAYPTNVSSSQTVIGEYASSSVMCFDCDIQNAGVSQAVFNIKGVTLARQDLTQIGTNELNNWTFIAGTWDGVTQILYVNGASNTAASFIDSALGTATAHLTIGAYAPGANQNFRGRLDDVRIYSRALTPSEIATIYGPNGSGCPHE